MALLRTAIRTAGILSTIALAGAPPVDAFETLEFRAPGASRELADDLERASLLVEAKRNNATDNQSVIADARAEYARLIGPLWAAGHYGATISITLDGREAASIEPLDRLPDIRAVRILVRPGPVYRFGEVSVAPVPPGTELPVDFRRGAVADADQIREAARRSITAWRDQGFPLADVAEQDIAAIHPERRVRARVRIDQGPRLRFGRFRVSGNQAVRESRIRDIAGFPRGERFSPERLDEVEERLTATGAFRSVVIREAETANADGTLDIDVQVNEQRPRRIGFGVEYSNIEGLGLSAFWMHRNFLEGAERFRIEGDVTGITGETGGIDYGVGVRFERPGTFDARTKFFATADYEHLDEPDYISDTFETTAGFSRQVRRTLTLSAAAGVRTSNVVDESGRRDYHLLIFPLTAVSDRREDNRLDPIAGNYLSAEVTPFLGFADSESGARLYADARIYRNFGNGAARSDGRGPTVVAGRLQFGSILGAALNATPNDYRFYSGGGGTVRGQDYQSLDVTLDGGVESGGASLVVASAEIRQPVTPKISAVAFYDIGYVGENSFPDGTGGTHSGAGLGVRYDTGIGPIRFDVAVPIQGETDNNFYFYIGIGQAF